MAGGRQGGEEVHQRPAWIIPLLLALGVAIFSAVFLFYYFAPSTGELLGRDPRASADTRKIEAVISGTPLLVPINYTRYPSQRSGGDQPELAMHALLPDFLAYSVERASRFEDNSASSSVIYFTLRATEDTLPAERRLKEIYAKYLVSQTPERDSTGLEKFTFKQESGFKGQDLLVGMSINGRLIVLTCQQPGPLVESPNCSGTMLLNRKLAMIYRYKRAYLPSWQKIDESVVGLVKSFIMTSSGNTLRDGAD